MLLGVIMGGSGLLDQQCFPQEGVNSQNYRVYRLTTRIANRISDFHILESNNYEW